MKCDIAAVLLELDRLEDEVGPGYDDHYFAALEHVREYLAGHVVAHLAEPPRLRIVHDGVFRPERFTPPRTDGTP